jgi:hypothetical protein
MELSPSWETVNCAATQELHSILLNSKVHLVGGEPEGLLPCSQESFTDSYPELDQSNPYHAILSL